MTDPTAVQTERALLIQADFMVTVNEWLKEGVEPQEVMAALAKAAADTIIGVYGASKVAPWFASMAANAHSTLSRQH